MLYQTVNVEHKHTLMTDKENCIQHTMTQIFPIEETVRHYPAVGKFKIENVSWLVIGLLA